MSETPNNYGKPSDMNPESGPGITYGAKRPEWLGKTYRQKGIGWLKNIKNKQHQKHPDGPNTAIVDQPPPPPLLDKIFNSTMLIPKEKRRKRKLNRTKSTKWEKIVTRKRDTGPKIPEPIIVWVQDKPHPLIYAKSVATTAVLGLSAIISSSNHPEGTLLSKTLGFAATGSALWFGSKLLQAANWRLEATTDSVNFTSSKFPYFWAPRITSYPIARLSEVVSTSNLIEKQLGSGTLIDDTSAESKMRIKHVIDPKFKQESLIYLAALKTTPHARPATPEERLLMIADLLAKEFITQEEAQNLKGKILAQGQPRR